MVIINSQERLDTMPNLTINDRVIPWSEVFGCLQLFGKLKPFLQSFVSEYVLLEAINTRDGLEVDSASLIQEIMDFRLKKNLQDQEDFKNWLISEHLDNATFQRRILLEMKVELLKQQIAAPDLQPYFDEHKDIFTEVKCSCLVAKDEVIAHELQQKITVGNSDFRQMASSTIDPSGESKVSYLQQQMQVRSLPSVVRDQLASAELGSVVGPVQVKEVWSIFRLEERNPATLSDEVKRQIESKLFGDWLAEQLRALKVGMTQNNGPAE